MCDLVLPLRRYHPTKFRALCGTAYVVRGTHHTKYCGTCDVGYANVVLPVAHAVEVLAIPCTVSPLAMQSKSPA